MRSLIAVMLVALAAAGGGLALVYSGWPDVAATSPHWAITKWLLSTTRGQAVRRRAGHIEPPGFIEEAERIRAGALAYDAMCAACHGAPGGEPGVVAEGLNPEPPELDQAAEKWSAAELFWITKHGVRMTGMPAFGPTHSDEELWEVVALVRRLPQLSPAEYRALVPPSSKAGPDPSHSPEPGPERPHGHRHDHSH